MPELRSECHSESVQKRQRDLSILPMPKVGASVLVVHLSNGSAMGIVAGTYWNSSHRPPVSGKGVYRKDLAQAIGEAFLQYSGSSLQIHAPAITLDASRIKLATKSGSITVAEIINHIKG